MKKGLFLTLLTSALLLIGTACQKAKESNSDGGCIPELPSNCIKGRLEIQDICGNFTIKVLEGNINPSLIQATWQHPGTKVTYQNVFSLGNICSFPTYIKQGDEFYFTVLNNQKQPTCVNCTAYAPTPDKTLSITVCAPLSAETYH
ncbi:MAG TPA: hypothetical protein VD794_01775 [Flavisolibacter sp.]|nr:hypothetical protein [Flavisolibacter sp.]